MATGFPRGDRYSKGAIAFHWVIAVLVLVNLAIGLLHDNLLDGVPVLPLHKSIGITVLVLSLGRLAWRLTHRPPPYPAGMRGWERMLAKAVHWLLYALMIAMPLTGWMFSSNPHKPHPFSWFGLVNVPLLPVDTATAHTAAGLHGLLGWTMAGLVLLHVAAALRHHFMLRDSILPRMLPWARRGA